MDEHICTVCFKPSYAHTSECYCGDRHFPALCCPGCDCGSFEDIHSLTDLDLEEAKQNFEILRAGRQITKLPDFRKEVSDLGLTLITEVKRLRKEIGTYRSEQYLVDKQGREIELLKEEVEGLRELVERYEVEEKIWRELLWLNHGHTGLYGDDGEMQCAQCQSEFGFFDYKRMPASEIRNAYKQAALKAFKKNSAPR